MKEPIEVTLDYQCLGTVKVGYKKVRRCNNFAPWNTPPEELPFRCYHHKLSKED